MKWRWPLLKERGLSLRLFLCAEYCYVCEETNKRICMVFASEKRKQLVAVKEGECVSEGE